MRIGETVRLEARDLREPGRLHLRETKGNKERYVPLAMLMELRAFWKTHRHPKWIFPGVGRGWKDHSINSGPARTAALAKLTHAVEPMGVGSIGHCLRLARAEARLPKGMVVHITGHEPGREFGSNRFARDHHLDQKNRKDGATGTPDQRPRPLVRDDLHDPPTEKRPQE